MNSVDDYIKTVEAPWGKMFYDLLFEQLNILPAPRLKILDFGSGLGLTSNHFAKWHDVTAIEPSQEMVDCRYKQNAYTQIIGDINQLNDFDGGAFDIVFCHNVLEYIEAKEPILKALLRVLKNDGILSVVKHTRFGRILHTAVFKNDPQKALSLFEAGANDKNNYLGTQYIYTNEDLIKYVNKHGGRLTKVLGMRTFWALGQDNSIKFTDEWYENMLELERAAAEIDEYKQIAFLNHLLFKKGAV